MQVQIISEVNNNNSGIKQKHSLFRFIGELAA